MERDLAAAVGGHHRDIARHQQMIRLASQALGEMRRMLADPQRIGRVCRALLREVLHRLDRGLVVGAAQQPRVQRDGGHVQSTTLTWGSEVKAM
ncbi:hypothetical protein D3C71_2051900 [compost metagenome]